MTGTSFSQTVLSGSMPAALAVAALAGLVSFASPCVLPLVPGYLGYVTGLTGVDLERQRRGRMVAGVLLFVLGFTAVFVTITATLASFGGQLQAHQAGITRVAGLVVIAMGLVFIGLVPSAERRIAPSWRPRAGLLGAPLLGAVFAVGWAPCTGPTLGSVLLLATSDTGGAARGVVLATAYSLGLGVPFLLVALGYARASRVLGVMRRHQRGLQLAGGGLLVAVGVLMASGIWNDLVVRLQISLVNGFEVLL
ncbi:MAG TPA: cytochrome c biogenesis protein CcdA [Actinomycetales bacterium]|jgi:cytochrome c-type biogenesis protein